MTTRSSENLCNTADRLEMYLQEAYETTGDQDLIYKFTEYPGVAALPQDENLANLAAKIFTLAEYLRRQIDHSIIYDPEEDSFMVRFEDIPEEEEEKEVTDIDTPGIEDQKKEYQRHIERAKELEHYANLVFEMCQDKEVVKALANDPGLVMAQTDEEFKKLACVFYTVAQTVIHSRFGAKFVFEDYKVRVEVGKFWEAPF